MEDAAAVAVEGPTVWRILEDTMRRAFGLDPRP